MRNINFKSIEVFNFKVHEHIQLDLYPNRFVLITGDNGSGKTSIMDAIFWSLYDETTNGLRGDSIVRHKSKKDTCVIIKFEIDGDNYEVRNYRSHSKFGDNKFIFKNNIDVSCISKKETNDFISKLVMPKKIFLNCLLFSQYIKESFIELTHSGQKDILDSVLNLQIYDGYYEKLSEGIKIGNNRISIYNKEIDQIRMKLDSNKNILSDTINSLEKIINNNREYINKIHNEISELKVKINNKNSILNIYNEIKNEIDSIKTVISKIEIDINNSKNNLSMELNNRKIELNNDLSSEKNILYKKHNDNISTIQSKINNKINRKNEIESIVSKQELSIIKKYDNSLLEFENKYNKYISRKEEAKLIIKNKLYSLNSKKNSLQDKIDSFEKEILDLKDCFDNNKICPTCGQNVIHLDKIEKNILDIIKQKEVLEDNIKCIDSEISESKNIYNDLVKSSEEDKEKRNEKINKILNEKKEELENNKSSNELILSTLKKELCELDEKLNCLTSEINHETIEIEDKYKSLLLKETKDLNERYTEKTNDLISKKEENVIKLKELNVEYNKLELQKKEIDSYENKVVSKIEEIENSNSIFNKSKIEFENRINDINKIISFDEISLSEKDRLISVGNRSISILEFWKKAFSDTGIKSIILDESIPILNKKSNEFSKLLNNIRIHFSSQSTLKSGEFRNKFSINVLQTKNLSSFSELSAGEMRMVNIVVLICLRTLMETMQDTKLNILLFDEILDSLDNDNISIAINTIRQLSKDYFVALITHTFRDYIECDEIINIGN